MKFDIPTMHTERLILRKLTLNDAADVYEYGQRPEVMQHLTFEAHRSIDEAIFYIKSLLSGYDSQSVAFWGIEHKQEKKLVGFVGFSEVDEKNKKAILGYVLHPYYWGLGIMSESITALLPYAFEKLGVLRLQAGIYVGNERSAKVLEKVGFVYEGTLRSYEIMRSVPKDVKMYSILRSEYLVRSKKESHA